MRTATLPDILTRSAKNYPMAPALISHATRIGFSEYACRVLMAANQLGAYGFHPGLRLAIWAQNRWEVPVLIWAMLRRDITAVPISTRLPFEQAMARATAVGCAGLIADASLLPAGCTQRQQVAAAARPTPEAECQSAASATGRTPGRMPEIALPLFPIEQFVSSDVGNHTTAEEKATTVSDRPRPVAIPADREATILFTSGSAGRPKAVLHTYANHYYSALGANRNMPFGPDDRWLLTLPLYHAGGLAIVFRAALGGGAVVIPEPGASLASVVRSVEPTHLSLVPTQLSRLLSDKPCLDVLRRAKAILVGGAPFPAALAKRAGEKGLPLFTTYGSTEMASQVTTTHASDPPERRFTAGRVLPYRELRIAADGEICVRGETRFKGIVTQEGLVQPFDAEGWYATGDLGQLDADGYLTVLGRKDNLFISGGENIQPEEIERALCDLQGVLDAIVVPVPHPEYGERPVAFVRMTDGAPPDGGRLARELAKNLERFKIPNWFLPWPEGTTGELKPARQHLRKLACSYMDRARQRCVSNRHSGKMSR